MINENEFSSSASLKKSLGWNWFVCEMKRVKKSKVDC